MDPFAHMAAPAGHQAGEASRPAKLIAGNRRHMHAHVKAKQRADVDTPSSSGRTGAAAAPPMPWNNMGATTAVAGPPGMPWMPAHSAGAAPPPPPPPPEVHAYAYADPVPASNAGGSLNSYYYKHLRQPVKQTTWQPPDPAPRPPAQQSVDPAPQPSYLRPESRSNPPASAAAKFQEDQVRLQDELMRMKVQNDLKREATAVKVEHAKQKADEASARRMKAREGEQRRREAEQSERIRQMEEAVLKVQAESRRKEERERLARQQQKQRQQPPPPAPCQQQNDGSRPFSQHSNPRQAQEDDFKRRQAAADARRQREAAANGAKVRPRPARRPAASAVALFQKHEAAWVQFERQPPRQVTLASIPWPPPGEDPLKGAVAAAMEGGAKDESQEIKSQYRRLAMRWHPDKFLGKFGSSLPDHEKEAIMERVNNTQQAVNQTYNILK